MTDRVSLEGLTFTQPAVTLGIAEARPDRRFALAVVVGPGGDRVGDDVLEYDVPAVDLAGVRANRVPLLYEHRWRLEDMLGGVSDAWLEHGTLMCLLRFARGGDADQVWSLVSQGFPVNVSVGAEIVATEPVGPSPYGGIVYRVSAWRLAEVSIVARGQRREAHVLRLDGDARRQLAERVTAAADAARLEVRRRLRLDRWDRWGIVAGAKLARELGVDVDRLGAALSREVAEHAADLERELAVPVLPGAEGSAG
jgi:hypothetical protein